MLKRYGTAAEFLELFTIEMQSYAAREWVRAFTGEAPKLTTVRIGYGLPTAEVWICLQLENINQFAGVKEKLSIARQKELALLIINEYGFLRVSELLVFFYRIKCGRYGRFYGSVDALFITSALLLFLAERKESLIRIEEEKEKVQRSMNLPSPTAITYEEYLLRKAEREKQQSNPPN